MLAKIKFHTNIRIPLQYNEQKVEQKKAECILAENFLKDPAQLTLEDKLARFDQRISLNERPEKNAEHISLNFGKTEQLTNDLLSTVAIRYMEGMGFEDQPYLVYRHYDAGHTHLHVVATDIRADGEKIHIRPSDFEVSRNLCKDLAEEYSLQQNIRSPVEDQEEFSVRQAQKVVYGEPGFKRAVSDVLNTVIDHYKYTSLDELNAVLREYNVVANPGEEDSRLRQFGGLLYHALDEEGNKIGVPLKASEFLLKPTLPRLEEKFALNQTLRESSREHILTSIEWAFAGGDTDWASFRKDLEQDGVNVVITANNSRSKEQIYFVDHIEKCVISGRNLGPQYELNTIQEKCVSAQTLNEEETLQQRLKLYV